MKELVAVVSVLGILCVVGLLFSVQEAKNECQVLRDTVNQQKHQLFVLVTEYNLKCHGDSASLSQDGTVTYYRQPLSRSSDTLLVVDTVIVYDTLTIVIEGYRYGAEFLGKDTLCLNRRIGGQP